MANPQGVNGGSIQINYGLASQSVSGNYSIVNWNLQLVNTGGGGSSSYYNWNFQYPAPNAIASGSGGWIYAVNNTVIASGQITVWHDVNGNGVASMGGWFSWYNGSGTAYATYYPPHINRYANITSFTTTATDEAITFNVSTDNICSSWGYSIDGGVTYTTQTGSFTTMSSTVHNLASNTSYTCYAMVTRADNGLVTYSSPSVITTGNQTNVIVGLKR